MLSVAMMKLVLFSMWQEACLFRSESVASANLVAFVWTLNQHYNINPGQPL